MEKLLITGEPGVGKSTLIDKLHQRYPSNITGIVAREIRDSNGIRQGFYSGTFEEPELLTIAHTNIPSEVRVGKYGVSTSALGLVAEVLAQQLTKAQETQRVVVYDEIGWMQTFSERLKKQIEHVIRADTPSIMTIKQDDSVSLWLKTIKRTQGVRLITVTVNDREAVFNELSEYVEQNTL